MIHSDYTYQFRKVKGRDFIMIEDKDQGGKSLTNDIHRVVGVIAKKENINPVEHYIIYRDSMGFWDGYEFATMTFFPLRTDHWLKAALKAITYE